MNLKTRIADFISNQGISANRFAQTLGLNAAYISGYLKEGSNYRYASKVEALALSYLDNFIQPKAKKQGHQLPFIDTKDSKAIFFVLDMAKEESDMVVISGEAGTGKSRAIAQYVSKHPEAILIEATISTTARCLFKTLAEALGLQYQGSLDATVRACAQALSKSDKFILIDEAEHLPYRSLELLRRLYDFSNTPLALVGTKKLMTNLTGSKYSQREYAQLSSRVGGKWVLQGLATDKNQEDLNAVCAQFGCQNKALLDEVCKLTWGNFRKTLKLLLRAQKLAQGNAIDAQVLKTATQMLLLK